MLLKTIASICFVVSVTSAHASSSFVAAELRNNLPNDIEKIEYVVHYGKTSMETRYEVVSTMPNGSKKSVDVSWFNELYRKAIDHLAQADRVPVKVIQYETICYMGFDPTSTLTMRRFSRESGTTKNEVVLSTYGCASSERTRPVNPGDMALAETLVGFMKDVATSK